MTVTSRVIEAVVAHAREAAPAECCGLLLGHEGAIHAARRTRNTAEQPTRFFIDPKDHIDGRREARAQGLDVVGFYHSHPHSLPEPSAADREEADYPDHLFMIVSLAGADPEVKLFALEQGNFRERPFVTVR
jgi:proteasome lid subunit RPN8/RPN11